MVSFRMVRLVQINRKNAMKMLINRNTNMYKIWNRTTWFYCFLMLELMILIQTRSLKPQECNGIVFLPWNALEPRFQFWNFSQKSAMFFFSFGRGFRFLGIRFASCLCMECIRVKFWVHKSLHWWKDIWFLWHIFSNLFHAYLILIMSNLPDSFHIK